LSARYDAVVIGSGPNGLVAANALVDAGWDVLVLEAEDDVGGAVRSGRIVPGYVSDLYSAFYPFAAASPAITQLDLPSYGLSWARSPLAVAHPRNESDDLAPAIHATPEATAQSLAEHDPRDGETWLRLCEEWGEVGGPIIDTLFTTFPPIRGPVALARRLGPARLARLARFMALPVSVMGRELFHAEAGRLLLAGNALHADVPTGAAVSGAAGYILAMLAQQVGFPVPVGGAGELTAAMARRLVARGGEVRCGARVNEIVVRGGRARAVRIEGGEEIRAVRAVIADVSAPQLYLKLLPGDALPAQLRDDISRFEWDNAVVKLNYAVKGQIPWKSSTLSSAGTIHLGGDERQLEGWMADIDLGRLPGHPFIIVGQMTTTDPTRSAPGTESAWAYTHLPRGLSDDETADIIAKQVTGVIEAHAPGFSDLIEASWTQRPSDLERANANLFGGALNAGTAQLHQQYIFRPIPGLADSLTPVGGVFLGSASAHPGGGVHGMCGMLAARAALQQNSLRGFVRRRAHRLLTVDDAEFARRYERSPAVDPAAPSPGG
jgi:phytoene dehydrogenase-like protein